jgi:hypothetical protein
MKPRAEGKGRIEDRRTPPRAAYLASFRKLILNDPFKGEDTDTPMPKKKPVRPLYFPKATGAPPPDPVAARKRIGRRFSQSLAGFNTGERRSGR